MPLVTIASLLGPEVGTMEQPDSATPPASAQASNVKGADRRRESIVILFARPPEYALAERPYAIMFGGRIANGRNAAPCVSAASVAGAPVGQAK